MVFVTEEAVQSRENSVDKLSEENQQLIQQIEELKVCTCNVCCKIYQTGETVSLNLNKKFQKWSL